MTKVLSGVALDQAATRAAIYRSPPNPHEKIAEGTRRTVLALAYKDGYLACAEAAHADYRALEERMGDLVDRFIEVGDELNATKEELASLRAQESTAFGAYVEFDNGEKEFRISGSAWPPRATSGKVTYLYTSAKYLLGNHTEVFNVEAAALAYAEEGSEGPSGTSYPSAITRWHLLQFANGLPPLHLLESTELSQ